MVAAGHSLAVNQDIQEEQVVPSQYHQEFLTIAWEQVPRDKCIKKVQILVDGAATVGGELALGKNVLVAYMPWEGYNSEDAVLISERLVVSGIYCGYYEKYDLQASVLDLVLRFQRVLVDRTLKEKLWSSANFRIDWKELKIFKKDLLINLKNPFPLGLSVSQVRNLSPKSSAEMGKMKNSQILELKYNQWGLRDPLQDLKI
ncbi:DNA-directed RNA polymerase subunit beta [Capsicum chinense]|nr:DNA-directed RNA polymerase subunit beta [Capsicum chinense]